MKKEIVNIRDLLESILFNKGEFCRIDIPIRVMAVEDYARYRRINNLWWRMQFSKLWYRWGKTETRTTDYRTTIAIQKKRLTRMVEGFSCGTFPDMPLTIGSNNALKDGAHRIACHIYFDSEYVPIEFMDKPNFKPAGPDKLLMEHYTAEETIRIIEYKNYLLGKYDLK
jgi:hypothetical protein